MESSDSQINKSQCGCPKKAELPDVNINTGVQSMNTERASLNELSNDLVWSPGHQCSLNLLLDWVCDPVEKEVRWDY